MTDTNKIAGLTVRFMWFHSSLSKTNLRWLIGDT
jgi:hypothetical protein